MNRQPNQSNSPNHAQNIQGGMTEDEALAHALARSIQELDESHGNLIFKATKCNEN